MAGPFVADLYTPNPRYNIPQGGATYLPLNGDWLKSDGVTRNGVVFSVSDTDPFDFGAQMPQLNVVKTAWRYGEKIQDYSRKDRNFKCSVWVKGDTQALMKWGVQQLQSILNEITQYTISSFNNDGLGSGMGVQMHLKYQPDSTTPAIYIPITAGYIDISKANEQIYLLQNMMKVTVNIRIAPAGFSDAVWLQNVVPNGTFAYGFTGYTFSGAPSPAYDGVVPSVAGPGRFNWLMMVPGTTFGTLYSSNDKAPMGMEFAWALNGMTPTPVRYGNDASDVWSAATYNSGGQVGTDIMYTPEFGIKCADTIDYLAMWMAFEYADIASSASFCSVQMQVYSQFNNRWANFGSAVVPNNNQPWARYSWNAPIKAGLSSNVDGGSWIYAQRFRIAFSFDRNRAIGTNAGIRKIALWLWPTTLPASMYASLPTEYVSQPVDITQACVVTSIQGTHESPVRVKIAIPQQQNGQNAGIAKIYQRAYIGARKYKKYPYKYYYSYLSNPANSLAVGISTVNDTAATSNPSQGTYRQYGVPIEDLRARQYRFILRLKSDAALAFGISVRAGVGEYLLVPNGSISEIPSTGGTNIVTYDGGIVTLPPTTTQHVDDGGNAVYTPTKVPNLWSKRSASSGAGVINYTPKGVWLIPADQYMDVDTRTVENVTNYLMSAWGDYYDTSLMGLNPHTAGNRELIIDMLGRSVPSIYMGETLEIDGGAGVINAAATSQGFMFYPVTPSSPEPMQFCCVVRRQGVSGAPAVDIVETDQISWAFLYAPAWEF